MKKALFAIAISLALAACGDDRSSNADDNSSTVIDTPTESDSSSVGKNTSTADSNSSGIEKVISKNGDITINASHSVLVDEENHILTITADEENADLCVKDGNTYTWKPMPIYKIPDSVKYEFHNDTLMFFNIRNGEIDKSAEVLVGGAPGNIYSKWTFTGCLYYAETKELKWCEDDYTYMQVYFTISEDRFVSSILWHWEKYITDKSNYINSAFMESLYSNLSGIDADIYGALIFSPKTSFEGDTIDHNTIKIINMNSKSKDFELGGKKFTVEILQADLNLIQTGNDRGSVNMEVQVEVTDGKTTCNLAYQKKYLDESLCKAENAEFFNTADWKDDDGNEFIHAYNFEKSNNAEFKSCIQSIAVQ